MTYDEYEIRYNYIWSRIHKARAENNQRALKLWKNKLNKWQLEYGGYSPVKLDNANCYSYE